MRLKINFNRQDYTQAPYWGKSPMLARFVIVGLGGTGGYLFYYLTRLVAALKEKAQKEELHMDFQIVIIDSDVVEEKNVVRQNFVAPQDIGKYKVEVLSERYGNVYDLNIPARPEEVNNAQYLIDVLQKSIAGFKPTISCLLGCVDNNRTRQVFNEAFEKFEGHLVYGDSGNDEWTGQIIFGMKSSEGVILPPVAHYYPDILEDTDKFPSQLSCQEQAVSSPQNIATNVLAATQMFALINQLFTGDGIESYGVNFEALTGGARPLFIDEENLQLTHHVEIYPFELHLF